MPIPLRPVLDGKISTVKQFRRDEMKSHIPFERTTVCMEFQMQLWCWRPRCSDSSALAIMRTATKKLKPDLELIHFDPNVRTNFTAGILLWAFYVSV